MQYAKSVLNNGLRLITIPMPSLESVTVTVWVKTGSRNETKANSGISHFLEHIVFDGSQKRPTAKDLSGVVDGIGALFNAGTSKEWTNYYMKCRSGDIETAFDVLSDMVINPVLLEKDIEKEKGTIIEEMRMYEDTPMMKISDNFEELIFANHPLSWDIAGDEKSIGNITKSDILSYKGEYYNLDNVVISVVGKFDELAVSSLVTKYFSSLPANNSVKEVSPFVSNQNKPQLSLSSKKKEQTHIILGFLADGKNYGLVNNGKNKYAQTLLSVILGGGPSSRLYLEINQRLGYTYAIRTSMDRYFDTGYLGTYAGLDTKKSIQGIKAILKEHYDIANGKSKISEKELQKSKEFLKGHLALALEDTLDVTTFFVDQELFLPDILTPIEVFNRIDEVSIEDVLFEARRLFVPERLNLAIIGPYENDEEFRKIVF